MSLFFFKKIKKPVSRKFNFDNPDMTILDRESVLNEIEVAHRVMLDMDRLLEKFDVLEQSSPEFKGNFNNERLAANLLRSLSFEKITNRQLTAGEAIPKRWLEMPMSF